MKVKIITGKYKPFDSDGWVRAGEVVDLPNGEAIAAIEGGAAKEFVESSSPQPPVPAEPAYSEPRRGKTSKSEE